MKRRLLLCLGVLLLAACGRATATPMPGSPRVIAVETFLADIAQNVAGDVLHVDTLMPLGVDPHSFEPTPRDMARLADSQVLILNGAGLEEALEPLLGSLEGQRVIIAASAGLTSRPVAAHEGDQSTDHAHGESDPHFWLDPNNVLRYVENIRTGLSQADPAHAAAYAANADTYSDRLKELDRWVRQQVETIPPERRLLVTNHESLGYFADRYGLQVVGTIVPSVSLGASPSAQQMAALIDRIKATGAPAIFLETGTNPQLAQQIATETGAKVVTELWSHSITAADGPAPTYIDLIRANTTAIVSALR